MPPQRLQTERQPRLLVILGSTGSIGRQALEVLAQVPEVSVVGLGAGENAGLLAEQAASLGVRRVCLSRRRPRSRAVFDDRISMLEGDDGIEELIAGAVEQASLEGVPLIVLNAIVGAAGLRATMATLRHGATLALANKESMVSGGPFVVEAARRSGALILPVDSEHSAIHQCLSGGADGSSDSIDELLLTGSGGPFRGCTERELEGVTPAQALAHPTWSMGPKISIDSATLMNKGLEIIEAHRLFGIPYDRITAVLNPQSIVHSMVRFSDGALLAHLGVPDMRTPIAYALGYPRRPHLPMVRRLDLFARAIAFEEPDSRTFRCLALAIGAGKAAAAAEAAANAGGDADTSTVRTVADPIVLNAANEIAVDRFLQQAVPFTAIPRIVEACLSEAGGQPVTRLDDVYAWDAEARRLAREESARLTR